ncbi:ABC transporter type 1, transmembrane domain-containing protein [Dioszegia hungarica]|uniref:ABC transporter type 1, transmembrane domain-containing protein n=1 Tax=Dioszegia hungarica TaxID=4972 RepID=A0AA38H5F8_9TREE|nr:ABC transporter type 1, transmembrane domain-containing protein [Dioszegia hungarica]KAI9634405.1 ABC transporter type 1, transmembrane domain-containing protein [Dioszegia hungarica]
MSTLTSWKCQAIWDGVDFTPCVRQRYLANAGLALIPLSLLILLISRLSRSSRYRSPLSPSRLTSPIGDLNLISLESDTILSALAANVLPAPREGEVEAKLGGKEAAEVIEDFSKEEGPSVRRWRRVRWAAGVTGALVWLGTVAWGCAVQGDWKRIAFPIYVALFSLMPRPTIAPLLIIHLIPTLLLLRSNVLQSAHPALADILPTVVEVVYWLMLMSLPYASRMQGLLSAGRSRGGGSLGSYGTDLPHHIEEPTSAFSRATYVFMLPFLVRHYKETVTLGDIPALREDDAAVSALAAFRADQAWYDAQWAKKHLGEERKRDLGWNLFRFFIPDIAAQSMWALIFVCLQYLPPTGLRLLLQFVSERETSNTPAHIAYLYVAMMAGGQCLGIIVMGQSLFLGRRLCIRIRAIIITEVFAKALRRRDTAGSTKASPTGTDDQAATGSSDGRIANLVSNDAFNISEICAYIHYLFSCPTAIIINAILLYNTLGLAAIAGIVVLLIFLPIGGYVGRVYSEIQRTFMGATDARLEAVTEVISHVKLIKFNAWEGKFFDRMMITRNKELAVLAKRFAIAVLFQVLVWGTPVIVTASAFAVHTMVLDQPLTADRAFASLILFNLLRDPLALIQDTVTRLLQAYTSCNRIQAYLDEPDTLKYQQLSRPGPGDPAVGFSNAVLGYSSDNDKPESNAFQLGPLNLSFPPSTLSIVVGPVGCGKTTLITSLLGETDLIGGRIFMPDDRANRDICPKDPKTGLTDTVAYCSQTPWLIGASIKENILFGSVFKRARYDEVIRACALERDLEIFELGDETEVGEKGTTCSGGQKARITLARAVYSSAKTVILDDILSAVDAQTARHLYNQVLQGKLMAGRTVIMVTHAVSLVAPAAGYVVMLEDGRVTAAGPPAKLLADGVLEMTEEMETQQSSASASIAETPFAAVMDGTTGMLGEPTDVIETQLDGVEGDALDTQKAVLAVKAHESAQQSAEERSKKKLVESESQASGAVGLATYTLYWSSMGKLPFWFILFTALIGAQVVQVATNAWIKEWANATSEKALAAAGLRGWASQGHSTLYYLGIYVALSGAYILAIAARVGINYFGSLRASRSLYDRLLKRILGAKMRFFDATPSGRITNRLSKDMYSIDTEAGEILMYFVNSILSVLAVLAVVLWSTPVFAIALIFIVVLYCIVGTLYITTSREIKRFDSVTRSPIFISFSEVLVGMSTIRSYGDSARFMRKLFHEMDQNSRCFWYLWQCNRVLHNFSNFIGSLVTVFAAIFALRSPGMDAGAIGLTMTYALSFTDFVLWIVRMYASAEMTMNSVERVGEYLDLEVEEEKGKAGIDPPAYWPTRDGSVVVSNLTCRYAPQLDPVLRDVSFEIGPREKIGICGRTGSGKSTLALSFFRFLHQESGSIVIDGLDIKKLSLAALRSRLTILPQEAQLFSGTIRDNLDPFAEHEDADVWDALQKCGLSTTGKTPSGSRAPTRQASRSGSKVDLTASRGKEVDLRMAVGKSLVKGTVDAIGGDEADDEEVEERVTIRSLDEKVAVGGKNFSQGQRQLLALARGLLKLRHSSFLIMDESTANLDHATDQTIQNVLRTGLADTQMLVIAHRLMTVCGLDKILVLDHGKVVEFGTPWDLIQAKGPFRELVKQSGEENTLIELARSVHEEKTRA